MAMRQMHARLVVGAFAAFWALSAMAQPVDDATRAAARQVGEDGLAAYDQGRYGEALAKLGQAYAVVKAPALGLWTARTLVKLGKLVEASERYLEVTRLSAEGGNADVQRNAKQAAAKERDELLPKIPKLRLRVRGARGDHVSVQVDGTAVPAPLVGAERPANPGKHEIIAKLGSREITKQVTLRPGESREVVLQFEEEKGASDSVRIATGPGRPVPESDRGTGPGGVQRTAGWVSLGVGGAGIVVGSIAGIVLLSKRSSLLDGDCVGTECGPSERDRVQSYNGLRPVSTVGFVVGVAGLGAGAALLLTSPKPQETAKPHVALWVGVGATGLAGRF